MDTTTNISLIIRPEPPAERRALVVADLAEHGASYWFDGVRIDPRDRWSRDPDRMDVYLPTLVDAEGNRWENLLGSWT